MVSKPQFGMALESIIERCAAILLQKEYDDARADLDAARRLVETAQTIVELGLVNLLAPSGRELTIESLRESLRACQPKGNDAKEK